MNFSIWGLSGSLNTQTPGQLDFARTRLWHWIGLIDASCNRFQSDSELSRLNAHDGAPFDLSPTLELALDAAVTASRATQGLCDPTVLPALLSLGYDRDYDLLAERDVVLGPTKKTPGVAAVHLDREGHRVTLDRDCGLDLGASAKALVVDLVARDTAEHGGVAIELGGDVRVSGQGPGGSWIVAIGDQLTLSGGEPRVYVAGGAIATSSTTVRTWRAGGQIVNHIIDPRTGSFARGPYATATVAADSCVLANALATAALLWGEEAAFHVAQAGCAGRLVRHDGRVELVGAWPRDEVPT